MTTAIPSLLVTSARRESDTAMVASVE